MASKKPFKKASRRFYDFGRSKPGILLEKLDSMLKDVDQDRRTLDDLERFYQKNQLDFDNYAIGQPLYNIALMRVASLLNMNELFNTSIDLAFNNNFVWEFFYDGDINEQKQKRLRWLKNATSPDTDVSTMKVALKEKLNLFIKNLFDGNDPNTAKEIPPLVKGTKDYQIIAEAALEAAVEKYPESYSVAIAHIDVTEDVEEKIRLADKYKKQFPKNNALQKIHRRLTQ